MGTPEYGRENWDKDSIPIGSTYAESLQVGVELPLRDVTSETPAVVTESEVKLPL